jgi:LacI family transcriptional regulator
MPSLKDVADEVGVSVSLVSKVLNDRLGTTGVRPELIDRIRETAERVGYRKNLNAAALIEGRQHVIAVAIHHHGSKGSGLVEELLDGISGAAQAAGQRQAIQFFSHAADFERVRKTLHPSAVDGLVVGGVYHPELADALVEVRRAGVPVVTVYNSPVSELLPNVGVEDRELTRLSTEHLVERGCRRILHIGSWPARVEGYRGGLARAGLASDPVLEFDDRAWSRFSMASGEQAVAAALEGGLDFDGVCGDSDLQAVGAVNELTRRGVRVPEEVKVTGIDASPLARACIVPLTSVSQRYRERGRLAVEMLCDLIGGSERESVWLEPELVVAASTGG